MNASWREEILELWCPIPSMYGIFIYITLLICMVNAGKYTIHGWYGCWRTFCIFLWYGETDPKTRFKKLFLTWRTLKKHWSSGMFLTEKSSTTSNLQLWNNMQLLARKTLVNIPPQFLHFCNFCGVRFIDKALQFLVVSLLQLQFHCCKTLRQPPPDNLFAFPDLWYKKARFEGGL